MDNKNKIYFSLIKSSDIKNPNLNYYNLDQNNGPALIFS
jgi:hypothetical protein